MTRPLARSPRARARHLACLSVLACLMSGGEVAEAASGVLELKAEGPCLSAAALERRLLRSTKSPIHPSLRVRVEGREPDELSFSIWRGEEQVAVRSFSANTGDCEDLLDALALAIALGLDATDSLPEAPTSSQVASKTPSRLPPPRTRSEQRRPVHLLGGALLISGLGSAIAAGASLGLAWNFEPPVTLLLGVAATWPTGSALGTGSFASQLSSGGFRFCYRASGGSFAALACAGADAGALFAKGQSFATDRSGFAAWAGAGVGPALAYQAPGGLGVLASLDAQLPLVRPHFDVQSPDLDTVASTRPGPFVWRLGLSASYAIF